MIISFKLSYMIINHMSNKYLVSSIAALYFCLIN